MLIKVSDYVAEWLQAKQIGHVFGIVGAGNAHLFDSIVSAGHTEIVCVHHEQAAAMAAQTYYRTSGILTAALLTTGAGSTNSITGVVGAWADSIPCMMISGNENSKFTTPENPLRMWGVQGYDSSEMVSKVCKYVERAMDPLEVGAILETAYRTALAGRPGPVWVDIPMNIQSSMVAREDLDERLQFAIQRFEAATVDAYDYDEPAEYILQRIREAKRPVFWLGHGIRLAGKSHQIKSLIENSGVPTLVSWAGIDMVDSDHPLVFGRAGVYGNRHANLVLQNSDLVVAIGTRLAMPQVGYDLTELAREASLVVVDIDPAEAQKLGERVERSICCDAGPLVDALVDKLCDKPIPQRHAWVDRCNHYKKEFPMTGPQDADVNGYINSYRFMDLLVDHFHEDQVVVTDMGTALLSGHQVLRFKRGQRLMTSTGLGEMGFGLPGAVGASFGGDNGEVLCLNCDGGMMMNLQELQTIAHHQLPIKIVVFNNDGYLMIKHTQKSLFKGRYSGTNVKSGVSCPNFQKIAAGFDFPYLAVRTWEDFETAIPQMQAHQGPIVCEVFMHPEQIFYPKLSLAVKPDGSLVSPPLEDLSPLLPLEKLQEAMIVGIHPKSLELNR